MKNCLAPEDWFGSGPRGSFIGDDAGGGACVAFIRGDPLYG